MRLFKLATVLTLVSSTIASSLRVRATSSISASAAILGNAVGYTVCLINYEIVLAANLLGLNKPIPACAAVFGIGAQASAGSSTTQSNQPTSSQSSTVTATSSYLNSTTTSTQSSSSSMITATANSTTFATNSTMMTSTNPSANSTSTTFANTTTV